MKLTPCHCRLIQKKKKKKKKRKTFRSGNVEKDVHELQVNVSFFTSPIGGFFYGRPMTSDMIKGEETLFFFLFLFFF